MDMRDKHVDSLQEDGLLKFGFVRSEENHSDLCTKNVNGELMNSHIIHLLIDKSAISE